jgi:HEAT repeat protein
MVRRRALGLIAARPDVFVQSLIASLSSEPSPLVREGVLEIIRPEHPEATQIVVSALADSFDFVRESAIYAAGRCALSLETLQPLLMEAVKDPSEKVREAAIRIGQRFDVKLPLSEILAGLRSHNEALLSAFMTALGAETTDDIDLALADIAVDGARRKDIRVAALARLGERGGEIAVWTVATLLADPDPEILATAIVGAQMIADVRQVGLLQRLSRHPIAAIRERVVYAMAEIGGDAAVETCLDLLFDPVAEIRERAVFALLRLGAATHLPTIERTLMHEESVVVLAAIAEARKAFPTR